MGKFGRRFRRAFKKAVKKIGEGFKKIGKAIVDVATDVARTITTFLDRLFKNPWKAIKGLIKGIIRIASNFIRALADGIIDLIGGVIGLVISVFGDKVASWFIDNLSEFLRHLLDIFIEVPFSIIQGLVDFIFNFLEGLGLILTIRFQDGGKRLLDSIKNLGSIIAEVFVIGSAKPMFAVQVLFGQEDPGDYLINRLTKQELFIIEKLFERSLNLNTVRYKTGKAGILGGGNNATTIGDTIYFRDTLTTIDPASGIEVIQLHIVLHELIHIWQFQNGGTDYFTRALYSIWTESNPYEWEPHVPDTPWENLKVEWQGQLIEDARLSGAFNPSITCFHCVSSVPSSTSLTRDEFSEYLKDAILKIRQGIGAP